MIFSRKRVTEAKLRLKDVISELTLAMYVSERRTSEYRYFDFMKHYKKSEDHDYYVERKKINVKEKDTLVRFLPQLDLPEKNFGPLRVKAKLFIKPISSQHHSKKCEETDRETLTFETECEMSHANDPAAFPIEVELDREKSETAEAFCKMKDKIFKASSGSNEQKG